MVKLSLDELYSLIVSVLVSSNTSSQNAASVATALVAADAEGLSSHGVARLPAYADQSISGKVDGFAVPEVALAAAALIRIDAKSGFAFPAIEVGMSRAFELVEYADIVGLGIRHSHHMGAAGYHVEQAAKRGYIALGFTNAPAAIAPWGGSRSLFGTNPIAFACPRVDEDPLVIDLSLSKVARGKVKLAADSKRAIPNDWAVDAQGNPTTDAQAALDGSLLPMGDAKGAALALMVEILAATLTGSNPSTEAGSFFTGTGTSPNIGHFFILIDPQRFALNDFDRRFELLLSAMTEQSGVRLPGARRIALRRKAAQEGVEIDEALYQNLKMRAGLS